MVVMVGTIQHTYCPRPAANGGDGGNGGNGGDGGGGGDPLPSASRQFPWFSVHCSLPSVSNHGTQVFLKYLRSFLRICVPLRTEVFKSKNRPGGTE